MTRVSKSSTVDLIENVCEMYTVMTKEKHHPVCLVNKTLQRVSWGCEDIQTPGQLGLKSGEKGTPGNASTKQSTILKEKLTLLGK